MNILIQELKNEMNKPKPTPILNIFYKYKLNDSTNINHNKGRGLILNMM